MRGLALGILLIFWLLFWSAMTGRAGEVEIVHTAFRKRANAWQVTTTLQHADTGWEHYADAWRVVNEHGDVLATRVLHHPHENEQPFTRSLGGVVVPADTYIVYVEAHDTVHGWSQQRIRVDLRQAAGERFQVEH